MSKQADVRFSVQTQDEAEVLARLAAEGFQPSQIEIEADGVRTISFAISSDEAMNRFMAVAPLWLSANKGAVCGNRSPFST